MEEDQLAGSTGSETSIVGASEVGVGISMVGEAMVAASTASIGPERRMRHRQRQILLGQKRLLSFSIDRRIRSFRF